MMVRGLHSVFLALLLLLALSTDVCIAVDCTGTADGTVLKDKLDFLLAGKAGEGAAPDATISQSKFTCQVQGTTMGTYQQLSVVVEYTNAGADNPNDVNIRQYELNCIEVGGKNLWESVAGSLSDVLTVDIDTLDTSQSCSACDATNGDADTHCVACHADCTTGLMRCTGAAAADCCAAFEDDGACSPDTTCDTANFVANDGNDFVCTCGLTCGDGQTLDADACTCTVTNICLANEPCENGGTCTVGADPATEYTCDCTGTDYMGVTCSECAKTCGAGEAVDAATCTCTITNICLANEPCENDGTCTTGADPATDYTCDCTGTGYAGDTCSECGLTCDAGHGGNDDCTECIVTNICEADNPCENGGACTLDAAPSDYTCTCTGSFDPLTDCSVCLLANLNCGAGHTNNSECNDCILSDTCEAYTPCQNNGTCNLIAAPSNYSCTCINHFDNTTDCSVCLLECKAGYTNNSDCSRCVLSDICEADEPCQNDGTCILNIPPKDYTCDCTNSYDPATDCSVCSLPCPHGYGNNSDCSACILTDICIADTPCQNGGTCTLGLTPKEFTCQCTNHYNSSTNCSECGLNCNPGFTLDLSSNCSKCLLADICVADTPCQNGGTCELDIAPDNYTCVCINDFDPDSNCTECLLECPDPGYGPDSICNKCVLKDICVADNPCQNGGSCTLNSEPNNYSCNCTNQYDPDTNCTVCTIVCPDGYDHNSDCTGCNLTSICVADAPCQNGGTCNQGSEPDQFTCSCVNEFTPNTNCTECGKSCNSGYSHDSSCSSCIVSNACAAFEPCHNGGTCALDPNDSAQFTCDCPDNFMSTNCSTCTYSCNEGFRANEDCNGCVLNDICKADNPCMNGGLCTLITNPNNYNCDCQLSEFEGKDCTDCNKDCRAGYALNIDTCLCGLEDICIADQPCINDATCVRGSTPDQYTCTCKGNYGGLDCESCQLECNNGVQAIDCESCECNAGYWGDKCDRTDFCAGQSCSDRGNCTNRYENFDCTCQTGYAGDECDSCDEDYEERESACVKTAEEASYQPWYIIIPAIGGVVFIGATVALLSYVYYAVNIAGTNNSPAV